MWNPSDPTGCFSVPNCDCKKVGSEILDQEGHGDEMLWPLRESALPFP